MMVMLSGMLIIIIGIGMLFFFKKQAERRFMLEFDIHRRLAAKSGFAITKVSGTGTYHYVTAHNRPDLWVRVGEGEPVYEEDFSIGSFGSNWSPRTDGSCWVSNTPGDKFVFGTSDANSNIRNELVFQHESLAVWNDYPFGLCYEVLWANQDASSGGASNTFPWVGFIYVGQTTNWNALFATNALASLGVSGVNGFSGKRSLRLYEYFANGLGFLTNGLCTNVNFGATAMKEEAELFLDGDHAAFGSAVDESAGFHYFEEQLSPEFYQVTNVTLGLCGFNRAVATNRVLELSRFNIRNPYEYEIYLSWTNRNRYFGTTDTNRTTDVLATVVDKTALGDDFYFFDSFETDVD